MLPSFLANVITDLKIVWPFAPRRRGRCHRVDDAEGVALDLHFIMSAGDSRVTSTLELEKVCLNQSNTSARGPTLDLATRLHRKLATPDGAVCSASAASCIAEYRTDNAVKHRFDLPPIPQAGVRILPEPRRALSEEPSRS